MKITNVLEKEYRFVLAAAIIFLILLYEIGISNIHVPTIIHDEIGYWANAAYYAGYDWSGMLTYMSYYGYGSGLILSVFMLIFKEPIVVYHAVMQFFVILTILSFLMAYKLSGDIFPMKSKVIRIFVCLTAVCYPTYIMNARIAWSEHFLFFFTWLNIFIVHSYLKKPNSLKMFLGAISLMYLYMIHQRAVGMVGLGVCVILWGAKKKKVRKRDVIIMIATITLLLICHSYLKQDIQQNLWYKLSDRNESVGTNDYSGRISDFLYRMSNYGISSLLVSLLGKIWYLIIVSNGILAESIIILIVGIKNRRKDLNPTMVYIYAMVIGAISVDAVATMGIGGRIDGLIYGRYMEHALSPMIMISVLSMDAKRIHLKKQVGICAFIMILSIFVYWLYTTYDYSGYLGVCAAGTLWAYTNVGEFTFVLFAGLFVVWVYAVFCILWKCGKTWLAVAIVCLIFTLNGIYARGEMYQIQKNNCNMIELAEYIGQLDTDVNVYTIRGEEKYTYMYMEVLQYLLPDVHMEYIQEDEIDSLEGEYILLVEDEKVEYYYQNEYIQNINNGWKMFVPKNSELYDAIIEKSEE